MSMNEAFGGNNVPGDASDKALALLAVLTQLHTQSLEDDGLPTHYSHGVLLILSQIEDLIAEEAEHLKRLRQSEAGGAA